MTTLEDSGYMYKITNSGQVFHLLRRLEGEFIRFFLRRDESFFWVECFSSWIHNNFNRQLQIANEITGDSDTNLNWSKADQIIKLAIWFENECLEREVAYLDDLTTILKKANDLD